MEYCADGTIAEVAKLGLPEALIRVYTYQTTKAINFLHQSGVVHRDIKGRKIGGKNIPLNVIKSR